MALTIKLETQQALDIISGLRGVCTSINDLSANIAKWQAQQDATIRNGLQSLIAALNEEEDDNTQAQINQSASQIRALREKLQTAINKQPKGE